MKLFFTSAALGNAFNVLTRATRWYIPSQQRVGKVAVGVPQLMDAAIRFSIQLAIDAAGRDQAPTRDLESTLIAKLATWVNDDGGLTMRLWTHDMACVLEDLTRAAYAYAHPYPPSVGVAGGVVKHVMETLPRNLTVAAVAFTIQLVLEETQLPAVALRGLESELIRTLEGPWEFGEISLSVDVQDGPSWGSLPEKA